MLLWRLLPLVLYTRASQQSRFRAEETHWGPHGPGGDGDGWASSGGMTFCANTHVAEEKKIQARSKDRTISTRNSKWSSGCDSNRVSERMGRGWQCRSRDPSRRWEHRRPFLHLFISALDCQNGCNQTGALAEPKASAGSALPRHLQLLKIKYFL
ncbi:hypothetical protein BJX62DRAFT_197177 [Aspergillus germanicus]